MNEADLLIRHGQSNHKRETIAFSSRRQASAERLALLTVRRMLKVGEVLAGRLFPGRVGLPQRWQEYFDRAVQTRELPTNRRHELKYAY